MLILLLLVTQANVASPAAHATRPPSGRAPAHPLVVAARATVPPVIDGRDDDPVWRRASPITDFREETPVENADPRFRTTGRFAYDANDLYVFLRAYDPHPDSIVTMLARRDQGTPSDNAGVLVDPYRDRRTGFEFDFNPSGVKSDFTFSDDGASFDDAWDGVWDVATRVDSLGWTAEVQIPLSQLRYRASPADTFGIFLWRYVPRAGEGVTWPLRRLSLPGLASQFGDLAGLDSLAAPRRAELTPYVVATDVVAPAASDRGARATMGADLRYALASNVTLNATVNPDFGQVDADPAELNLTQFETFFPERRSFFVEGAGQFAFDLNCGQYACAHEALFYSRRLGRSPELRDRYGSAGSPAATRILGAGKLTGRVGGLAFGALSAATERVNGPGGLPLEPSARYEVARVTQSLRGGEAGVGLTLTGVQRDLDAASAPYLHRGAYAGGVDVRSRFSRQYVLRGSLHASRVEGSAAAIAATQREPIHNYQRPDGTLTLDTTRTSLSGDDEQLAFDKLGGVFRFEAIYTRRSPGFEINDLGYLRRADQQTAYGWLNLTLRRPTALYRTVEWNLNGWWWATAAGLVTDRALNANVHWTLNNLWRLGGWISVDGIGTTFCDDCARGGPALRQDRGVATWWDVAGDDRHSLVPEITLTTAAADGGRSRRVTLTPRLTLNLSSRFGAALGVETTTARDDRQWLANPIDTAGVIHYTFARLDQHTLAITARASYTLSTTFSLQAYVQPFASWGTYSDPRELARPRAADYANRFQPWAGAIPAGVNAQQLNADVVLRWEYHPGSTIFVVWTQGRRFLGGTPGRPGALDNLRGLFDRAATNTFLIKASHWFNW